MAKKYGYLATIGADTSGLTAALNEVDTSIKKTENELSQINKALKLDPTNTELLIQKQDALNRQLDLSREKMQSLEEIRVKMAQALANNAAYEQAFIPLNAQLEEARKNLAALKEQQNQMKSDRESGKIDQTAYNEYIKELKAAKNAQKELKEQTVALEKRFEAAGGHINIEDYRQYKLELGRAEAQTANLTEELKKQDNALNNQHSVFDSIELSLKKYNTALNINESELKKITAQYSDNAESVEALTAKQKLYEESISGQKQKIAVLNTALTESKKYYGENADETLKWQKAIVDAETSLIKTEKNLDSVNNSLKEQNSALDKAEDAVKDYDKSLDNANKTTVTFGDLVKANFLGDLIADGFRKAGSVVGDFIQQGITLASDLTEVQNVVDVTFGDGAAQIYEWSDAAAESFGMSSLAAQQYNGYGRNAEIYGVDGR